MQNLTGQKFGKLTVLKLQEKRKRNTKGYRYYWLCQCECGNKTIAETYKLKLGHTKSCGCLVKEKIAKVNQTHNLSKTRIYKIYSGIKKRCFNTKSQSYNCYGARGIKVCDEWLNDFKTFYDWAIKNGYKDNYTIDRIDVNGNYEPNNCRWVTSFEQASNRRNNHNLTYKNVTHTIADWSRITQIKEATIRQRINDYGWSVEKALTKKVKNVKQ